MKYAALLVALLGAATLSAQKTGMDKAYKEACDCIEVVSKKKIKEEEKKTEGMDCLQRVMLDNFEALAKDNGYTLSEVTPEVGRQIGEKFGQNLVAKCPASIPFFMDVAKEEVEKSGVPPTAQYIGKGSTKGTFLRLDTSGESPKVVLKVEDGTEESFLWIRPFSGADHFESNHKTLINKKITIEWGEFRKYVFSMKAYAKVREITALTVN
ncbi:MAG TPA: hypothetical protein PK971_17120 [Saprospiraceae bacterium]|nr:hypothetical protein [Saprospiraceae bacterium]HND90059.1 hypothetical protein [Saprospiraceae bacterium]